MARNHQYIWRFDTMRSETDPARKHIVEALLQAYQDKVCTVFFGPSCVKCRPEFHWAGEGCFFGITMPQDLDVLEVRRCLVTLAGLDKSTEFPKQTELVLDFDNAGPREESSIGRMCWVVSMITPEGQITLERR